MKCSKLAKKSYINTLNILKVNNKGNKIFSLTRTIAERCLNCELETHLEKSPCVSYGWL